MLEGSVFPNPNEGGEATVAVTMHLKAPVAFTVRDLLGQTVLTAAATALPGTQKIALPQTKALPVGVYYLTVQQGNAQQVLRMSRC